MDKDNLQLYKKRLEEEKKALLSTIDSMMSFAEDESQQEVLGELSMIDNHPADVATEMEDREKNYALVDNEKRLLVSIESAIKKINDGTFGKCSICGGDISPERLDFMPYASVCIECEKEREGAQAAYQNLRPVEEDVLGFPFGRKLVEKEGSFMDVVEDYNGFDGEDSWQRVERYNQREGIYRNYDDDYNIGCVEPIEHISNQQYKNQQM